MLNSTKLSAPRPTYMLDHHDTSLTVGGERFRVSFLPLLQRIVYTSLDTSAGGEFDVRGSGTNDGYICSKEPRDEILQSELEMELAQ